MIHLQIITPEKTVFAGEVDQISLPTESGQITVLPNHVALITTVTPGELIFKINQKENLLAAGFGFAQVGAKNVKVLVDLAAPEEELQEAKIEEAKRTAQEAIAKKHLLSEEEYAVAAANLQKALTQLRIKHRHRKV